MPVSTLRWTGGTAPTCWSAISAISADVMLMLSRWAAASATSPEVRPTRTRMGASAPPVGLHAFHSRRTSRHRLVGRRIQDPRTGWGLGDNGAARYDESK